MELEQLQLQIEARIKKLAEQEQKRVESVGTPNDFREGEMAGLEWSLKRIEEWIIQELGEW